MNYTSLTRSPQQPTRARNRGQATQAALKKKGGGKMVTSTHLNARLRISNMNSGVRTPIMSFSRIRPDISIPQTIALMTAVDILSAAAVTSADMTVTTELTSA